LGVSLVREHVAWCTESNKRLRLRCTLEESGPLDIVRLNNSGKRAIALTFDGGSKDTLTEEILDVLLKHNLQCTMFLTGQFIQGRPELVQRMIQEGHELANHTMTHPRLAFDFEDNVTPGISRAFLNDQLGDVEKIMSHQLKKFWRAPFGHSNELARSWALALGYYHIYWTYDSRDWTIGTKEAELTARVVCENTLKYLRNLPEINGEILLFHLMQNPKDRIAPHLSVMIEQLQREGVEFKTVSQLFKASQDFVV